MTSHSKRAFKNELYSQFARIGKALGSPQRLEFLDLLAQGEWNVEALANETHQSVANTSRHLQVLRGARLVDTRREGTTIFYRLADLAVFQLWQALRDLGSVRLAEVAQLVDAYLHERQAMEAISCHELLQRLHDHAVLVLDVRPPEEYAAGHIAGARSLPLDELAAGLRDLSPDTEIVAYCRGPYCVLADDAIALLRARGFRARRLTGGFPDWRALGMPVESNMLPGTDAQ